MNIINAFFLLTTSKKKKKKKKKKKYLSLRNNIIWIRFGKTSTF